MKITIDINDGDVVATSGAAQTLRASSTASTERLEQVEGRFDELIKQMGDEIAPFPKARMGGYISHFRIVIELPALSPDSVVSIVSPPAAQSVAWGDPFVYNGPAANHRVRIPLPSGSTLSDLITEADFIERPAQFFVAGRETLWLQILNLDATMDTKIGPVRIVLGETIKREYPDLFKPSLGVAQSLGNSGFPATLFFNPYAIIETPMGKFRAVHGILSYGRVTAFPPVGTPVSISSCIPLEEIGQVRAHAASAGASPIKPVGRIVALSHPIDMEMQLSGEEAFRFVERSIASTREPRAKD
jgi:hypothetical protein